MTPLLQVARLLHALHHGIVSFVEAWETDHSDDDDDADDEPDPDRADPIKYIGSLAAWHSYFEDVALKATDGCVCNGSSISEAADLIARQLEIEHAIDGIGDTA